jgi:hypothetical protein
MRLPWAPAHCAFARLRGGARDRFFSLLLSSSLLRDADPGGCSMERQTLRPRARASVECTDSPSRSSEDLGRRSQGPPARGSARALLGGHAHKDQSRWRGGKFSFHWLRAREPGALRKCSRMLRRPASIPSRRWSSPTKDAAAGTSGTTTLRSLVRSIGNHSRRASVREHAKLCEGPGPRSRRSDELTIRAARKICRGPPQPPGNQERADSDRSRA